MGYLLSLSFYMPYFLEFSLPHLDTYVCLWCVSLFALLFVVLYVTGSTLNLWRVSSLMYQRKVWTQTVVIKVHFNQWATKKDSSRRERRREMATCWIVFFCFLMFKLCSVLNFQRQMLIFPSKLSSTVFTQLSLFFSKKLVIMKS